MLDFSEVEFCSTAVINTLLRIKKIVVRDKAGVDLFGSTVLDEGVKIEPMAAGERRMVRVSFVNPLAAGPHGVALTFMRRPDYKGEGPITLDHMDAAGAFESVGSKRVVRGKMYQTVRVVVETMAVVKG